MNGHCDRILVADLTKKMTQVVKPRRSFLDQFLGGSGLAARILYDFSTTSSDPLSPSSPLLFMTGPLTGTSAPCSGRHVVCGRSPLTGLWGESHVGGRFGAELKFAGLDGVLVIGQSENPCYLHITEQQIEIRSAESLWGMTTSETQQSIREEVGRCEVATIGPAGENLVHFAGINHDGRVAARCGLGAVMGSKNLKALAVQGSQPILLAYPHKFKELARKVGKSLRRNHEMLSKQGTAMYVTRGMLHNDMPIRYFQDAEFDVDRINADAMKDILVGRNACYSCPIGCGRKVELAVSEDAVMGPEFQTIAAFGTNLLIDNLPDIARLNHLCNEMGIDTISTGGVIGFAISMTKCGRLSSKASGHNLQWGDSQLVYDLIVEISHRRGFGDSLANGIVQFAQKIDSLDQALHVKGLDIPYHDPRAFVGMATTYAIAARGAAHTESDVFAVAMDVEYPELGINSGDRLDNTGKGELVARVQDFRAFCDSVIVCHFPIFPLADLIDLLNFAIGSNYSIQDIPHIGARGVTLKRLINLRLGFKPKQDTLPKPLLQPLKDSIIEESVPDLESQLDEYYRYRKWDRASGIPSLKALKNLQLDGI
ncbi:MAG: aldehyde ferredoxin oxidoreductase [Candidatus Lokiarchaeota archaeon]|nr:aldehyde ferredoxin oxidoreductase [Candidatus Lokiarchaeota archaeon]